MRWVWLRVYEKLEEEALSHILIRPSSPLMTQMKLTHKVSALDPSLSSKRQKKLESTVIKNQFVEQKLKREKV